MTKQKKNELKEAAEAEEEEEEDRTYGTYRTNETNETTEITELPATHTSHEPHTTHSSHTSYSSPQKALYAIIREALAQGQKIPLPGLGSLSVTLHAAHMGRNPRTGESIAIPARRRVHFKAAKGLQQLLNP
ncbi:nucleoid DNA-binding protein [Desulfomicrobium apsheronum]|uniref:Nucleoid DNA-binding protein n=1 Tax=Desulfomicrobium apsheronum TaxID=52560 RepID=A0A1I3XH67_9BACT|nr:HU family DNA-binding protein [Desulfomicrobium apsheronum]SFK18927.1 nucleoid DNA-binding protein [Desulfomicrobium apsheronum]